MHIRVDLLPPRSATARAPTPTAGSDVVVLIDVLRSGTAAAILLERGLVSLGLTASLKQARLRAAPGTLLFGEREGIPPEGFNYGNSPADLAGLEVAGKDGVMTADNLPRALSRLGTARHVLLGSLYNAEAVTRRALELAESEVSLVCCGLSGEEDLDDSLTAGFLAAQLKVLAEDAGATVDLVGAARFAISLLRAFPDPFEALWQSVAGHELRRLDLVDDVAFASQLSLSDCVPVLKGREGKGEATLYRFTTAVGR